MSLFPPSDSPWILAYCDGGSRGNPGPSGYGAVVTSADGQTLAELSEFLGTRTNNFAEYSGLLAVLRWALEHGHPRLRVVSDSELMVKQIQGKYKVNSPDLKPLWQLARDRIAQLDGFEISHALRHKNKAADALANQAMDRGMNRGPERGPERGPDRGPDRKPERAPDREISRSTPAPPAPVAPAPPSRPAPRIGPQGSPADAPARAAALPAMLRGFTRGGSIQLLGGHTLPDGIFVKIIPE